MTDSWEDSLAREMGQAEQRAAQRAAAVARAVAARDTGIAELWGLIDRVVDRVNRRVGPDGRRFHREEVVSPPSKAIYYGGRRLLFEVEALAYDAWHNEPVFCPGGLARIHVDPPARDLTALFYAVSSEGARWLVMPTRRRVTDETIGTLLRVLLS